ncbi:MAG: DUF108 domain-containing protein [candidate division NC10 bacterium]|nr:DUF108 domain-containing protein [candidate division NC10 bacterium]
MLTIGIAGCGTIGTGIARAIEAGRIPAALSGLHNRTRARAEALAGVLSPSPPVLDLLRLVRVSDLVVEAATGASPEEIVPSNVNVSAALSLAGIGPDRTRVRVILSGRRRRWRRRCF